ELPEEGGDRDLEMFDKAFDSIGGAANQPGPSATTRFADGQPAPARTEPNQPAPIAVEVKAPAEEAVLGTLIDGEEAISLDDPESRIAELEQKLAEREAELDHARKGAASTTEVIRVKESKNKAEKEILRLKEELNAK